MGQNPTSFSVQVDHQFTGEVTFANSETRPGWLKITHSKHDPASIHCDLSWQGVITTHPGLFEDIRFSSNHPYDTQIRLFSPHQWELSGSGTQLTLKPAGYEIVWGDRPVKEGHQMLAEVRLTRGRAIRPTPQMIKMEDDGNVTKNQPADSIKWNHEAWKFSAYYLHDYDDANAAGKTALVQTQHPAIRASLTSDGTLNFRSFIDELETLLEDALRLISLSSRERTRWYEADVSIAVPRSEKLADAPPFRALVRNRELVPETNRDETLLIDYGALANGGFDSLYNALRNSDLSPALRRAIDFIVGSRVRSSVETSSILCNAALEAVAWALEEQNPHPNNLPKVAWKQLVPAVRTLVENLESDGTINSGQKDSVLSKISELKRVPVRDVIAHHSQCLGTRRDQLWPKPVGFDEGIRIATAQRNAIVHKSSVDDHAELFKNTSRLQLLVEWLILDTLGWPEDKLFNWHDDTVRFFNR